MTDSVWNVKTYGLYSVIILTLCVALFSCSGEKPVPSIGEPHTGEFQPQSDTIDTGQQEKAEQEFILSSQAFKEGAAIPFKYTCKGENISPQLTWSGTPTDTVSFVLILDDPDAPGGVFTHWIVFNIPSTANELREGAGNSTSPASSALHGKNDMRKDLYGGPCPPPGNAHHYRFTLYAIDTSLDLAEGASKQQVLEAIEGHVIGRSTLTGTFKR
jgi:Raf kinase inhibitor-like YbhB/YbcL family protein